MKGRPVSGENRRWRLGATFRFAFRGLALLLRTEVNARIHLAATAAVTAAGIWFRLSRMEWCAIAAAIGLVWTAEGLNTALETIVDLVSPEWHPLAGRSKDLAAAAVLCAAIAAAIIGALVFGPRFLA